MAYVIRILNGLPESDAAHVRLFRLNNKNSKTHSADGNHVHLRSRISTVHEWREIQSEEAIRLIKFKRQKFSRLICDECHPRDVDHPPKLNVGDGEKKIYRNQLNHSCRLFGVKTPQPEWVNPIEKCNMCELNTENQLELFWNIQFSSIFIADHEWESNRNRWRTEQEVTSTIIQFTYWPTTLAPFINGKFDKMKRIIWLRPPRNSRRTRREMLMHPSQSKEFTVEVCSIKFSKFILEINSFYCLRILFPYSVLRILLFLFWCHSFSSFQFLLSFQKSFTLILQALDMYNSSYPGKHWLSKPHGAPSINTTHFTLQSIESCPCVRSFFSLHLYIDHCRNRYYFGWWASDESIWLTIISIRASAHPYEKVDRIEYIFRFLIFNANAFQIFKSVKYRFETWPTPDTHSSEYIEFFRFWWSIQKTTELCLQLKTSQAKWMLWLDSCFHFAIISCLHSPAHTEIHQPSKKYASGIRFANRPYRLQFLVDFCFRFVHFNI